jgi:hypothetical protein
VNIGFALKARVVTVILQLPALDAEFHQRSMTKSLSPSVSQSFKRSSTSVSRKVVGPSHVDLIWEPRGLSIRSSLLFIFRPRVRIC